MGPGGVHTCAGWREYFPSRSRATGGEARSTCADADAGEEKGRQATRQDVDDDTRTARTTTRRAPTLNPATGVPRPSS